MRTPLRVALVAVGLSLALTGCSKDAPEPGPQADPSPTTTADPTASPDGAPTVTPTPRDNPTEPRSADDSILCADPSQMEPFTGPVAVKFGAEAVMDAYCETADFFYVNAATSLAKPKPSYAAREFHYINEHLTPGAQEDWNAAVAEAIESDNWERVQALVFANMESIEAAGYVFPDENETAMQVGGTVSPADLSVERMGQREILGLSFTITTNLVLYQDGEKVVLPIERSVGVAVAPNPDPKGDSDWLLNRWATSYRAKHDVAFDKFIAD